MVCMIFIVHTIPRIQMQFNMTSPAAYEIAGFAHAYGAFGPTLFAIGFASDLISKNRCSVPASLATFWTGMAKRCMMVLRPRCMTADAAILGPGSSCLSSSLISVFPFYRQRSGCCYFQKSRLRMLEVTAAHTMLLDAFAGRRNPNCGTLGI